MLADASLLTFNATLVFQFLIFVVTATFLWKVAWGPITAQLAARQAKIAAGLTAGEEGERRLAAVKADVENMLDEARVQARDILSRSHKEAAAEAEDARVKARQEAEAIVLRAREEITAERDRAITELRVQVGTLVVAAAGRVLGHAIDADRHEQLIAESLRSVPPGS